MHKLILTLLLFGITNFAIGQSQAHLIKEGNGFFKAGQFDEAVASYNQVTDEAYKYIALLNTGTTLYRQKKFKEAIKVYKSVSTSANAAPDLRSEAFYNTGVIYSKQEKLAESIAEYKNALRLNSNDNQARENLQKALAEQKKQSGGGGGGEQKPNPSSSNLDNTSAQKQLDRLAQKEKNTKSRIAEKKNGFSGSNGKSW